jgi:hypothetical protein
MNCTKKLVAAVMSTLLVMLLTTNVQAQTKQPVTNQTVTTDDGRKVILKSNGTWQFVDKKASSTKGKGTLSFETGLVLRSGDTKPVSRTTFYLLDNSFAKILFDAGIKEDGKEFKAPGDIYSSFVVGYEFSGALESSAKFVTEAMQLMKPHVVQEVTTGFDGKATFKPVQVGTYYLMGHSKVSGNYVIWDTKVDISSGKNFITLDQNNMNGK